MKFIIYNPRTYLFDFFLNALSISLKDINIDILIYNDNNKNGFLNNDNIDYKNDIIMIIINPHFIFDYIEIQNNIY